MLYLAETPSHSRLLAKRVERGALRRLARGIYSDDFDRTAEEQISAGIMAIVGHLFPRAYVSHSTAALRAPIDGVLFISETVGKRNALVLPGVRVVRLPALPHPEIERIEAPTAVVRTRDDEPGPVMVGVSSALQTVFESLMPARHYPEKRLPEAALLELIEHLSARDRQRAAAFAERNGLHAEYRRYGQLTAGGETRAAVHAPGLRRFELYFYNWHVGSLTALSNAEFRYEYAPGWAIELSRELPLRGRERVSYEGPRMPAFFENFLPEGWTENRILKTYRLDPDDRVGLLASTRKYPSNLTLRPLDIPESEFRLDAHGVRLADIAQNPATVIRAREHIEHDPETAKFWRELRARGAVGLSGIQPKLPVSLALESGHPSIRIGDLRNPCTHILKFQSPHYEFLVENEWATMELARRAGLRAAPVRLVTFGEKSPFRGQSLLVERFDIPDQAALDRDQAGLELLLQEDACSILLLARTEKYRTSLERVAAALHDLGLSDDPAAPGLWCLVRHVAFSWLVANGDLHAKNMSAVRIIRPGTLGAFPKLTRLEYSPLYDLLNTTLAIPDDDFALPVNGRKDKLRVRDIAGLATRWKGARSVAEDQIMAVAVGVRRNLDDVLGHAHLPEVMAERYRQVVDTRLRAFGV
jgi:serine/threonine-protein kinase HipA